MLDHLLFVIVGIDFAITLAHMLEEWKGSEVPLWRNFGAIVGVCVPDWLGFPFFFLGLTALLWFVGFVGITGGLPMVAVPKECAAEALGVLLGARIGDTLISHLLLYGLGYRPNPGLRSTALYVAETLFLAATFTQRLTDDGVLTWWGFAAGAGFFCLVLPGLWLLRILVPSWRRDRWRRGKEIPPWTKTKDCTGV